MIKRKMSNTQRKGGKRNLVKKATSGLLVTSLATGVVMNANVFEANAETLQPFYSFAKGAKFLPDDVVSEVRGDEFESQLKNYLSVRFTYNEKLNYSRYKKTIDFNLTQDSDLKEAEKTIKALLNYHGSTEFYLEVLDYKPQTKDLKVLVGFDPDTSAKVDGYAVKLNLPSYTEDQMKTLENRYVNTLQEIGYNVVNHKDHQTEVNNVRFRRNLDNGYKQSEYDFIMGVMDKYIKKNPDAAKKQFALKVWQEGPHVCIRIFVGTEAKGEQAVDSEQAKLLEMIEILRGNYEKEKAKEVVAPVVSEPVVSEPVVEKVEEEELQADEPVEAEVGEVKVEEPSQVEETVESEELEVEVLDAEGQTTEVVTDEDGFSRIHNGGAVVITVEGETSEQKAIYNYGTIVNKTIFELINKERINRQLSPLTLDEEGKNVVDEKCLDMVETKKDSLLNSDGVSAAQYLRQAFPAITNAYDMVGNCYKVPNAPEVTAQHIVQSLLNNPRLNEKLLDNTFTHVTIGVGFDGDIVYPCVILSSR